MLKRTSPYVAVLVAGSLMGCALGGCGTNLTPQASVPGTLDPAALAAKSGNTAEDPGTSTDVGDGTVSSSSDTPPTQTTVAAEAESLAAELQSVLGTPSADTAGTPWETLFVALADAANNAPDSPVAQAILLIQSFQQLRTEIQRVRHTLTRAQAAQLLLSALATADTSAAGTGSPARDLLAQVQNLLAALRATSTQPAASADTLVTP
jgi:hypothetical protein